MNRAEGWTVAVAGDVVVVVIVSVRAVEDVEDVGHEGHEGDEDDEGHALPSPVLRTGL